MRALPLLAALLLAGAAATRAYTCDESACKSPDCMCPSSKPPSGLSPKDIPQFVLISHDDSINQLQNRVVRAVTDGFKNPNGCNVPATWFALKDKTNCTLVMDLVKDNHEIAGHTMDHVEMRSNLSIAEMTKQVKGIKDFIVDTCGVPADKFVGFRAPYLKHNEKFRNVLQEQGYEYDASILEAFNQATSPSFAERLFPYTMDNGIPQNCAWSSDPESQCSDTEKHAGLWEVPLWILPNEEGAPFHSMDPVAKDGKPDHTSELLIKAFDEAYNGNRAPFPLFVHAPWFTFDNTEAAIAFMEYATQKKDVWFVTFSQLLDWMKNPVPASQYNPSCQMVELTPPTTEYCRTYKAGPIEDVWTIAGKFGIALDTSIEEINPGLNKWTIAEGTLVNLPPWDERCEKKGATKLMGADDLNWYQPKYTEKVFEPVPAETSSAPAPAPAASPSAGPEAVPATVEEAVPTQTIEPAVPQPVEVSSGAAGSAASAAAALLAAVAALCLLV
jgi:hypothetical protein